MLTIRDYKRATSLEEAWTLNQKKPNRVMGGMMWLRLSKGNVMTMIDLSDLGLDKIEETETEYSIGAMVTLRQLELHEGLETYTGGALKEALRHIVGVQFRNMATVGGSIFGRFGFSDVLTLLLVLDAKVELFKAGVMSLAEFAERKYDRDILVRIILPKQNIVCTYKSVRISKTDFPVLTCAASWTDAGLEVACGARPAKAKLVTIPQALVSKGVRADSAKAIGVYVAEQLPTESNPRGSAKYRTHLIEVLTMRSVLELAKMKEGGEA